LTHRFPSLWSKNRKMKICGGQILEQEKICWNRRGPHDPRGLVPGLARWARVGAEAVGAGARGDRGRTIAGRRGVGGVRFRSNFAIRVFQFVHLADSFLTSYFHICFFPGHLVNR